MPTMMEIYRNHSYEYDELVSAEDAEHNLKRFLQTEIDWKDKVVVEAGIGTGRLTKMYVDEIKQCIGLDREEHMLDRCKENLLDYESKILVKKLANENLSAVSINAADVFIEGWSFGHTVIEAVKKHSKTVAEVTADLVASAKNIVRKNGKIVLIESEGTNVQEPFQSEPLLQEFYRLLEVEHGFIRHTLRTDYRFATYKEAARIMGFFFGEQMGSEISCSRRQIVPEFTGVWITDS